MIGKVIRIGAGIGVAGLILAVIIMSVTAKPNYAEKIWDERTVMGDVATAENHFIMYTDVMCPYCDVITRLLMENEEEFKRDYIENKHVIFEVRLTDFLYEYGAHQTNNSREGAEAIYCARDEGKFWEYYHATVQKLWDDYQSKGIGADSKSTPISDESLDDTYWLGIGKELGLGEGFKDCYLNHRSVAEIQANTDKAAQVVESGLPYLRLGKTKTLNGFSPTWGWGELREQFDLGLKG